MEEGEWKEIEEGRYGGEVKVDNETILVVEEKVLKRWTKYFGQLLSVGKREAEITTAGMNVRGSRRMID